MGIESLRNKDKEDLTPEDLEVLALDNSRDLWNGSTAAELIVNKIDAKERAAFAAAVQASLSQASLSTRPSTSTSDVPDLVDDASSPAPTRDDDGNTPLSSDDEESSLDDDNNSSGGGGGEDDGNESTSSLEEGASSPAPTGDVGNSSLLSIMGTTLFIDHTASRNHVYLDVSTDFVRTTDDEQGEIETILLSDDNNNGGDDDDESSVEDEEASGGGGMVRRILDGLCGALDTVLCCCCDNLCASDESPIYAEAMAKRKRDAEAERIEELTNVANGVANATDRQVPTNQLIHRYLLTDGI